MHIRKHLSAYSLVTLAIAAFLFAGESRAQDYGANRVQDREDAVRVQDGDSDVQVYWVFLTTGKPTAGVPQEEIADMQAAHLQNFGRLAQAGKLLTAGPMKDPDATLRGIVVLQAKDLDELNAMFAQDPYVTQGYMNVESHHAELSVGKFTTKLNEQGLDELRIAVISSESQTGSLPEADITALREASDIQTAMVASFSGESARRGCIIFRSTDDEQIKTALDRLSSIQIGKLSYALMPQFLGKGALEQADD